MPADSVMRVLVVAASMEGQLVALTDQLRRVSPRRLSGEERK